MSARAQMIVHKRVCCHFCDRSRFHMLHLEAAKFVRLCWYCSNYLRFMSFLAATMPKTREEFEEFAMVRWLGEIPPLPTIRCSVCEVWCSYEHYVFEGRHINLCGDCLSKFWKEGRRV